MSLSSPTTTTTPIQALRAQGVATHVAERLTESATPDLISAWCAHVEAASRNGSVRNPAGLAVNGIRSGHPPPEPPRPRGERGVLAETRDWLRAQLPEVCDEHGEPHLAAVQALLKLRFRYGRGKVTARAHGAVIRAAVLAAEKASGEGEGS